jgi:hypothetical protein
MTDKPSRPAIPNAGEAPAKKPGGGQRILDGLKDAVAGNFARVTIDGQTWVRRDGEPAPDSGWMPIETAPKDGTWILAYEQGAEIPAPRRWENGFWLDEEDNMTIGQFAYSPTHWRALPAPPGSAPPPATAVEFDRIRALLVRYAARLQDKNKEPPGQFLIASALLQAVEMLDLLHGSAPPPAIEREGIEAAGIAAVRKALVENWSCYEAASRWDEDVLLTGCKNVGQGRGGRGYFNPEEAANNLARDAFRAVAALLAPTPQAVAGQGWKRGCIAVYQGGIPARLEVGTTYVVNAVSRVHDAIYLKIIDDDNKCLDLLSDHFALASSPSPPTKSEDEIRREGKS